MLDLHPKVIDLSLERIQRLLAALGYPEQTLPRVIHVAGTNGKGSVVAMVQAMLEAAGHRVHTYTSPHLVHFHERIRLAGQRIDEDTLAGVLAECEAANAGQPITFFEITTAAALLAMSRVPADVTVLETGLGGRLDATNVVDRPALTAITALSMDHESYLGETIADIAIEKAGIMKAGVPCLTVRQTRMADKVLGAKAETEGAPLFKEGRDWSVLKSADGFIYESPTGRHQLPTPALHGGHQIQNAGLALALVENVPDLTVPEPAMALGLRTVSWPARLQRLRQGPLVAAVPEGWEIWLDGGHNEGAAKALVSTLRGWRDRPLYGVMGMMSSKKADAFLKPLVSRFAGLRTVAIPDQPAGLPAELLSERVMACGGRSHPTPDVATAVASLVAEAPMETPGRVLICGSLYLAGSVLAEHQ